MKYTITKLFIGNVEINLSKKTIYLTLTEPRCVIDEDEYEEIIAKYEYLILNGLILVKRIETKIEVKKDRKLNKK